MRYKDPKLMENIKAFVDDYYAEKRTSPSIGKIATAFGCARSTIYRYLLEMAQKGMIFYDGESIQTPQVVDRMAPCVTAPIVGAIRCGSPEVEFESIEGYVNLPEMIFGRGDFYILRANGDSMADVGIEEGDLVVVEKAHSASIGDIVVALDENQQNTLKTYAGVDEASGQAVLKYANQKVYPNAEIRVRELMIQGVARKVIKTL